MDAAKVRTGGKYRIKVGDKIVVCVVDRQWDTETPSGDQRRLVVVEVATKRKHKLYGTEAIIDEVPSSANNLAPKRPINVAPPPRKAGYFPEGDNRPDFTAPSAAVSSTLPGGTPVTAKPRKLGIMSLGKPQIDTTPTATVGGRTPTAEQILIIEAAQQLRGQLVIEAGAGCLAADTVIHTNRAGKGREMSIAHVAAQFNGEQPMFSRRYVMGGKMVESTQRHKPWDLTIPTYVGRAVGGVVRLALLKTAWYSGVKETFTVTTDTGRAIRATAIHPFLMGDGGWRELQHLDVGSLVQVNVGRSNRGRGAKINYEYLGTDFHPAQTHNGGGRYKVPKHRLIVEADRNGLTLRQLIWILRHDRKRAASLTYLTAEEIVHHVNHDTSDNSLSNLQVVIGEKGHSDEHEWVNNVLWQMGCEEVVSVEPYGCEPTYDIEVESDPHNFLANGFAVHNTGKTTTLSMLATVAKGRGQYTAFNSSLVKESKAKFGGNIDCNTTHSLAFRQVGKKYAHRLGGRRVRSSEIAHILGVHDLPLGKKVLSAEYLASCVMQAVKRFRQTADPVITCKHFKYIDGIDVPTDGKRTYGNNEAVRVYLEPFAAKAWADISSEHGVLPFSHDDYVKVWQLNQPRIYTDYILLDEAQDTAEVFLDILRQQKASLILVGDSAQQIYEWRGAVNAMASFPDAPRKYLSQSFRFGPAIADIANRVLDTLEQPTQLRLKGLESIPSRIERLDEPTAVLCRTNASAVGTLLNALAKGKRPHLIGGGADVIAFVEAAQQLQRGQATSHPDLACFSSWGEVQRYVKEDEGEDLKLMVKIIDGFRAEEILRALRSMVPEPQADLIISTAHKAKGREWDRVQLASDFPARDRCDDADRKLLYVAVTRAKLVLDVTQCPWFGDGREDEFYAD